jgi:hypothetical protein
MLPGMLSVDSDLDFTLTTRFLVHTLPQLKLAEVVHPVVTYAAGGSPLLPNVNLKSLPPQTTTALLQEFLVAAWSKYLGHL